MASDTSLTNPGREPVRPPGRNLAFLTLWILSLVAFRVPLSSQLSLALHDERYTHTLLVPFISAFLLWVRRDRIFRECQYSPEAGFPLLLGGIVLEILCERLLAQGHSYGLPGAILATNVVWIGLATLCYGIRPVRQAAFPLLFLLLMVPFPAAVMDRAVTALQKASADMTAGVFKAIGVPFQRNDFIFSLPGVDIRIAEECSGIRSSLSLLLSAILAAYLFLESGLRRLFLVVVSIPIVIFKNAVRIATISWLGVYVDRSFFFGNLHRYGGLPFSLLAVAIFAAILWGLRRDQPVPVGRGCSLQ